MEVIEKLPITIEERLEMDKVVRFPASWHEFYTLLTECQYRLEYYQKEIISMGFASEPHELIVANIIRILGNFYLKTNYRVYGSNRLVYIEECEAGFNPNILVVKGESKSYSYKKMKATTNPYLIVEVLSKSTQNYDLVEKLPCYKKISTLQHVVFVAQDKTWVSVYSRLQNGNEWLNIDFDTDEQELKIDDIKVFLSTIYDKIVLV
jgi:Uma2 family endonuclease